MSLSLTARALMVADHQREELHRAVAVQQAELIRLVTSAEVDAWGYIWPESERQILVNAEELHELNAALTSAEARYAAVQARYRKLYPAPARVVEAIEALHDAHAKRVDAAAKLVYTDEQRAIIAEAAEAEAAFNRQVEAVKAEIKDAGKSPTSAFTVSTRTTNTIEGDIKPLLRDVSLGDLTTDLVSVNVKALAQRAADGLDNRGLSIKTETSTSVSFYADRFAKEHDKKVTNV